MNLFTKWSRLFIRWTKMLGGKSYYHQPQCMGKVFRPNELAGYFNDLTGKTHWTGSTDDEEIPVNILVDGRKVYFATTIVQKALGHWDKWLLEGQETDKKEFLKLNRWLLSRQDENGGWPLWRELDLPLPSPYSAMTQGECISAFVRAWMLTEDDAYAEGARRALTLMCKPIEKGGPAIYVGKDIFLEEVPHDRRVSILNGWIFALFGLYDSWLVFNDKQTYEVFKQSLDTLLTHLGEYDAGYWSYYDVQKHLASPFYHDLHIHQLKALAMVENSSRLTQILGRWEAYQHSRLNRFRALSVKALQKLREPGEAVIIR
ncbi:D-glucuronyl C5-epimerase [Acetomicrobium mobile DSM 13181]|uniref:D-glucuronyl C5-epimerase n=1 Tax=Acetomicrobium mobile (strain ATCC BAA-54 / DSM 13181 / JCM 12221 / NGA) TaxID=891968 RepID=I4BX03_ACEMN|nr:D-glucuronyl C5-epimerase family protein [Acetomicrobium mobile]AFM21810.1 D-glucuronyl C5-epimerase [Acetomicrobium mobile DSM 13181]